MDGVLYRAVSALLCEARVECLEWSLTALVLELATSEFWILPCKFRVVIVLLLAMLLDTPTQ